MLMLGDVAPDFLAMSTDGPIQLYDYMGDSWCVFFSHPKDFTPVCTTELGYMARMKHEFTQRNTKLLGISVDRVENHVRWKDDIAEIMGAVVRYPLIGDPDLSVAKLYGLIHPNAEGDSDARTALQNATARCLFIISPAKKIMLMIVYPMSTGRHFDEVLRVLDSLQMTARHGLSTPANWEPGSDVLIPPALPDDEAQARFPNGFQRVKSYFRTTNAPK